jgi:hypothetical protein
VYGGMLRQRVSGRRTALLRADTVSFRATSGCSGEDGQIYLNGWTGSSGWTGRSGLGPESRARGGGVGCFKVGTRRRDALPGVSTVVDATAPVPSGRPGKPGSLRRPKIFATGS